MVTPFFILWIVCAVTTLGVVAVCVAAYVIAPKNGRNSHTSTSAPDKMYMIGPVVFTEKSKP